LYIKRRREAQISDPFETEMQPDLSEFEKDDEQ